MVYYECHCTSKYLAARPDLDQLPEMLLAAHESSISRKYLFMISEVNYSGRLIFACTVDKEGPVKEYRVNLKGGKCRIVTIFYRQTQRTIRTSI